MLQYTVHPPPLSLPIRSKNAAKLQDKDKDHVDRSAKAQPPSSHNDHPSPTSTSRFAFRTQQRPSPDTSAIAPTGIPPHHAVSAPSATLSTSQPAAAASTAATLMTFPLSTTSSSSSALPSPTFPSTSASKRIPRSPYIHAPRPLDPIESVATFARMDSHDYGAANRSSNHSRLSSSLCENVFFPGDRVGEGIRLQGERVRVVPSVVGLSDPDLEPAKEFEVVRRLGTGSYAVVYLVREVFTHGKSWSDEGHDAAGQLELDDQSIRTVQYGREYAIKCLSKENLDEDALAAQMAEVNLFLIGLDCVSRLLTHICYC